MRREKKNLQEPPPVCLISQGGIDEPLEFRASTFNRPPVRPPARKLNRSHSKVSFVESLARSLYSDSPYFLLPRWDGQDVADATAASGSVVIRNSPSIISGRRLIYFSGKRN